MLCGLHDGALVGYNLSCPACCPETIQVFKSNHLSISRPDLHLSLTLLGVLPSLFLTLFPFTLFMCAKYLRRLFGINGLNFESCGVSCSPFVSAASATSSLDAGGVATIVRLQTRLLELVSARRPFHSNGLYLEPAPAYICE